MSATPRLYVTPDLAVGADLQLDGDQAHYLTRVLRLAAGDPVVLLGEQGGQRISADELAAWAGTISYEILTGFSARVPRRFTGLRQSAMAP